MSAVLTQAVRFRAAYYSLIPIRLDGSKAPVGEWKRFQQEIADEATLMGWFGGRRPFGLALVHGAVSRNSEAIDIDWGPCSAPFYVKAAAALPALRTAPIVKSPREGGGFQLFYRNAVPASGNVVSPDGPILPNPASS